VTASLTTHILECAPVIPRMRAQKRERPDKKVGKTGVEIRTPI
jgi:hypothetical protein